MSTIEVGRDELISQGSRVPTNPLLEQAGYSVGVAALDGPALLALLPKGHIDEVNATAAKVTATRQDKAVLEAESKDATRQSNETIREGKVWRRKASKRALRAKRLGKNIPDGLVRLPRADNPQVLAGSVMDTAKLLEANQAAIGVAGTDKLIEAGKKIAGRLTEIDAKQEVKRLSQLPDAVKNFYEQKGALYIGLKVINDAGHELHADNPANAAKYNLTILHRQAGAKAKPNNVAEKPKT